MQFVHHGTAKIILLATGQQLTIITCNLQMYTVMTDVVGYIRINVYQRRFSGLVVCISLARCTFSVYKLIKIPVLKAVVAVTSNNKQLVTLTR